MTYDADIAHCMGRACAIRDKCYRYWLRKELCKKAVNGFLPPKSLCILHVDEEYDFETGDCEMFYPMNK